MNTFGLLLGLLTGYMAYQAFMMVKENWAGRPWNRK